MDQVVLKIRGLIRDKALRVGDTLPSEAELSAMFGAGRNTVREAVRTLRAYGVVESRQKVGAVITNGQQTAVAKLLSVAMDISLESFRDIQGYRRLTEMNIFPNLMQNMTDEDLARMEDANARMISTTDLFEASRWDYRFHQAMVDAARNTTLSELYGMLEPVICRLMEVGKSRRPAVREAEAQHGAIVQALRERSAIDFAYHMNRHLDAGLVFLPQEAPD
ncbi:FadR/GntR family transcriptional regulator [Tropicimonas sp. IMCC6043]|uniref:FadR/GntR family transcriptional regulator n=1 Tax=Tropicimonas sp. IMCC6043 TaxID=2510645 RepID=UPI001A930B15|nr:FCD domain-containing protein [Tropicimonas sp. IMCC6043]